MFKGRTTDIDLYSHVEILCEGCYSQTNASYGYHVCLRPIKPTRLSHAKHWVCTFYFTYEENHYLYL